MDAYQVLNWDSTFFGFAVARIDSAVRDPEELSSVLAELRAQGVRLAYWSTLEPLDQLQRDAFTSLGGRFVDEKTTFLHKGPIPPETRSGFTGTVEEYRTGMSQQDLRSLALQSGEYSRYACDPGIPRAKFEELYTIWIDRSLRREIAEEVFVIRTSEERVVAMVTVGKKGDRGDIGLIAVDADFRGRHYGEQLVRHAVEWFAHRGCRAVQVVTQGTNAPACRLYAKCGFAIEKKELFYHFWL